MDLEEYDVVQCQCVRKHVVHGEFKINMFLDTFERFLSFDFHEFLVINLAIDN